MVNVRHAHNTRVLKPVMEVILNSHAEDHYVTVTRRLQKQDNVNDAQTEPFPVLTNYLVSEVVKIHAQRIRSRVLMEPVKIAQKLTLLEEISVL
jgi:predicted ABC-type ATPase